MMTVVKAGSLFPGKASQRIRLLQNDKFAGMCVLITLGTYIEGAVENTTTYSKAIFFLYRNTLSEY